MVKEFEIGDILNAVNTISNIGKKERKIKEKKDFNIKQSSRI